ncbi:MAG: RdgB/HAM1 family non-canonical purine NTP pyrophosphatase [Bdellovibrionales bacterium]|nr:RdgB/HAM1 family non-canonical purine NTP pyrophosphatase [Bdellovibrionales bacterium]
MRVVNKIVLASLNPHKFLEFRSLLSHYPEVELLSVEGLIRNAGKLDSVETHPSYLENALAKSRLANQGCHYPCLADDSGLEVISLQGRPGVKSRRYALPKAGQSQDHANVQKLLEELQGKPESERQARFVATLALSLEGISLHAAGILEGTIAQSPRGTHGFGYDPIFIPKGSNRTLAEMTDAEKNSISHRAVALKELMTIARARNIQFARP